MIKIFAQPMIQVGTRKKGMDAFLFKVKNLKCKLNMKDVRSVLVHWGLHSPRDGDNQLASHRALKTWFFIELNGIV